jgi:hypothetical protein
VAVSSDGSSLLTGNFFGAVDFGSGVLTSMGSGLDVFVAKLDESGSTVWSRQFGDASDQAGTGIAVDPAGSVVLTGQFAGQINLGGLPLASAGTQDVFLGKLDGSGNYQWSGRFGDSAGQFSTGVATDHDGNVLLTGYFSGAVDFGAGPLMCAGGTDIFVAKFSP